MFLIQGETTYFTNVMMNCNWKGGIKELITLSSVSIMCGKVSVLVPICGDPNPWKL